MSVVDPDKKYVDKSPEMTDYSEVMDAAGIKTSLLEPLEGL